MTKSNAKVLYLFDSLVDNGEAYTILGLQDCGYQAVVICEPNTPNVSVLKEAGVEVVELKVRSKLDVHVIKCIKNLKKKHNFDLIYAYRKRALSNYILASIGDESIPILAYRGIIGNLSYWDPFSWLTFLNPAIKNTVCVCKAIQDYYLNKKFLLFFNLFNEENTCTIYKGHDLEWYSYNSDSINKPLLTHAGVPAGSKVIGCVSRLKSRKGIKELIQAMPLIPESLNAHLVFIGKPYDQSFQEAYEDSPCKERIHFLGFQTQAPQMAGEFDIITLASLRREGLPRAIIEGMAQQVPAVVTDSGGSPELIQEGITGLIVPPANSRALANAFTELLEDDKKRQEMGRAAQIHIKNNFNIKQTIKNYCQLFDDVLGQ
ncbi:glycosyltransferase family 4 protein [Marinospirillum sp.]|uniref:glycosyltransferase family 4 protein n=1 Tax=Marinospirillum sp. TaxID=2183934 RepID=UPI00384ACA66